MDLTSDKSDCQTDRKVHKQKNKIEISFKIQCRGQTQGNGNNRTEKSKMERDKRKKTLKCLTINSAAGSGVSHLTLTNDRQSIKCPSLAATNATLSEMGRLVTKV